MNITDKNLFVDAAKGILDSVAEILNECGRPGFDCQFVGFDRPAEDHCPDLVAWVSNIRAWDGDNMDSGLIDGRLKCHYGVAFDVTVRLGRCYFEMDDQGNTLDRYTLESWSNELYQDAYVMYIQWIGLWKSGGVLGVDSTDSVNIGPMTPHKEGGCAGWEFTITLGVI